MSRPRSLSHHALAPSALAVALLAGPSGCAPEEPLQAAPIGAGEGPRKTAVVRLSDGRMWEIPATDPFEQWDVVGVTCEEAFVLAKVAGRANIARVRLDSLGPGLPPD